MYKCPELLIFFKFFTLLICSGALLYMYVSDRQTHPTCLWNGAMVYGLLSNGTIDKQSKCEYGECDKQICDYISAPGILTVSIELLPPFPPTSPKFITKDYVWMAIFVMLFLIIMMDIIDICCIMYTTYKGNYEPIKDDTEEYYIAV